MFSVLAHPAYRRLFTAQVVALLGTGLLTVALGLLAFDLAGSDAGAVLGTALTIKMVAYVGVAPVVAALVERLPTKAVLVTADVIRALVAISLPFLTDIWQIYLLVFILQSASATFTPTFQAVIPAILPDEKDYTRALSLSRLAYDIEALVSPIVAAILLTVLSYTNLFLGTALGFILSATFVIRTTLPARTRPATVEKLWRRTTIGARLFFRTPSLRFLMLMNLTVGASTALVVVNTVVYSRDVFGLSNSSLATALACYGAGSLLVAVNIPRLVDRFGDRRLMLTGGSLSTLGLLGSVAMTIAAPTWAAAWWLLLGLWVLIGAGNSMISTPSSRLLVRASTDSTRGYIYTAQFSLSHACFLITYPLAGWLGSVSLTAAAATLGALAAGSTIAATRIWRTSSVERAPAHG